MRIISLIASATEIVSALGFENQLVGRSHECDYPIGVKKLPACSEPKFNIEGTSYQIDQRVKAILQEGLSVYRVHADMLEQLQPDLIVTQDHCEVCAVSLKDVEDAVCKIVSSKPKIVSLEPNNLDDIWSGIAQVAEALGALEKAEELVGTLQDRMSRVAETARKQPHRPTVACIEWVEPLMAGGNWVPELVEMAGGVNLFGEAGKHSPWMTFEELAKGDPDIIVVMPCGYDMKRALEDMPHLQQKAGWQDLRAVKNKRVYIADGNQYFNRPGPRVAESLEIMAEIFHPAVFPSRFAGNGWVRFDG